MTVRNSGSFSQRDPKVQISVSLLCLPQLVLTALPAAREHRLPVKPGALSVWGSSLVQEVSVEG